MRDILITPRTRRAQVASILAGRKERTAVTQAALTKLIAAGALAAIDVATFGLFEDANATDSVAITATDRTLTCADNPWVADDVGKLIHIAGAGAAGAVLVSRIATFTSAGEVEIADAAVTTVAPDKTSAGGVAAWGWPLGTIQPDEPVRDASDVAKVANRTTPTGAATRRSLADRLADVVNVMDFGAVGGGVIDDTAAFEAAIAALPADGGCVEFPAGRFAVNLVITKSGVLLRGRNSTKHRAAGTWTGLTPFDPTKPAVTIGDDTGYVEDVTLADVSIGATSGGTAACGLKLAGGTYRFRAVNLAITGFARCLWLAGGAAFPVTFININGYSFHGGTQGAVTDGVVHAEYGAQFCTAVYLNGGAIGAAGGAAKMIRNDSCQLSLANSWIECPGTRKGLYIIKNVAGASPPFFSCVNVSVDSPNSADILLENMVNASLVCSAFFRGLSNASIDGYIENNVGATAPGCGVTGTDVLIDQLKIGENSSILFPTRDTPGDTGARIAGIGAAGARRLSLISKGYVSIQSDSNVTLQGAAGSTLSRLSLQELSGATQATLDNNAGNLVLTPSGAGKYVKAGDGAWNGNPLRLGVYYLWIDATGALRIKGSAPTGDTDGTVVGTQT